MIIELWKEPEPTPEIEKVVRLRVTGDRPGTVVVEAVDEKGQRVSFGSLARVSNEGLERFVDIDPALGFPLDSKGRIVLVGED